MSIIEEPKEFNYKVHKITLNETKKDFEIPLNSPIVYITNTPIAIDARINSKENDKFNLTTVQIIKTPNGEPIDSLHITTTTTSTDKLEIITSDVDIFSDIGIEDRAVLVDTSGVEYDARGHSIGSAIPSIAKLIAGSDGTNLIELMVQSATQKNLRVTLFSGANNVDVLGTQADGQSNTLNSLVAANFMHEFNNTSWDRVRHSYDQTTTGITATGAGATLDMTKTPMSKFTMQSYRSAGSDPYVIDIEGSLDGSNWDSLGTMSSSGDPNTKSIVDAPQKYIRYNVTTIGSGNTLVIDLLAVR